MERFFTSLIAASLLLGGVAVADFIDHPMYAKVNTFTESVVQQISDAQAQFFIEHGRYFQGIWILGDQSVDGVTDITIDENRTPDDENISWADFLPNVFKKNIKIPANIKIDVYESPQGWGWIFRAKVIYPGLGPDVYGNYGDKWVYQHHAGPEERSGIFDEWYIQPEM